MSTNVVAANFQRRANYPTVIGVAPDAITIRDSGTTMGTVYVQGACNVLCEEGEHFFPGDLVYAQPVASDDWLLAVSQDTATSSGNALAIVGVCIEFSQDDRFVRVYMDSVFNATIACCGGGP